MGTAERRDKPEHNTGTTMYVTTAYGTSSYLGPELEGQTFECRCAVLSCIRSTRHPLGIYIWFERERQAPTLCRHVERSRVQTFGSADPRTDMLNGLAATAAAQTFIDEFADQINLPRHCRRNHSVPCASMWVEAGGGWWN